MSFEVTPLREEHVAFVHEAMRENKDALHAEEMSLAQWRECLLANDPDEAHFIILTENTPAAWLKINGLAGKKTAWISMLVVRKTLQRCGAGSFAVRYAEDFARVRGFRELGIHTTLDNEIALGCYTKLGYRVSRDETQYTFRKKLR